jgi:hypothetical protein
MKGELMEEQLREHFMGQGCYVVRGILYTYDTFEITDVDLWLYNKQSSWNRERTIVDIKNKKTPQAIERIFWTKGLMSILRVNNCIVATTDKRPSVKTFGRLNNVIVLDGSYLDSLKSTSNDRYSEEDFCSNIRMEHDPKFRDNWVKKYIDLKTILIKNLDYSGCNYVLNELKYFLQEACVNTSKRIEACRLVYISISFLMIIMDFLLKDSYFLEPGERSQRIGDGLMFGNLGKAGVEHTINLAMQISNAPASRKQQFYQAYEALNTEILKEYFAKPENISKLFVNAKYFEKLAFERVFTPPTTLNVELKGLIGLFLDYARIERRQLFNTI